MGLIFLFIKFGVRVFYIVLNGKNGGFFFVFNIFFDFDIDEKCRLEEDRRYWKLEVGGIVKVEL